MYPWGSAVSLWLLTPGFMSRKQLQVKIYDTFKKCFLLCYGNNLYMQIVGQTWLNLVTLTYGSWSEGQHDLYFTVQWFYLISSIFDVCTSFFGIMNQYDLTFNRKINLGYYDLYFMIQWFCLVSWRLFDVWTSLLWIMNQYDLMLTSK